MPIAQINDGELLETVREKLNESIDESNKVPAIQATVDNLGSAAFENVGAFATTAQGEKADTALQPATIGVTVQAYSANLDEFSNINPSNAGANLIEAANASAQRTVLELGTAATTDATDYATAAQGALADTALQPSAIGVSVQAYSNNLDAFSLKTAPIGDVVGTSDTQTLSNKRINVRINGIASAATITPTADLSDQYNVTALAVPATIAAPSGTPVNGQRLVLRIKDDGTARALTWTTSAGGYRGIGISLPVTTFISKTVYFGLIYNAQDNFWDVVAMAQE